MPSGYPYMPPLLRSNTAEQGTVQEREVQSADTSPTTLNQAQQEAFDILTGKVDRQQLKLQKKLDDERTRREALADESRTKQAEEQARRHAERRAQEEARQIVERQIQAKRRVEKLAEGIREDERRAETERHEQYYPREARADMQRPHSTNGQDLRQPRQDFSRNQAKGSKSRELLDAPPDEGTRHGLKHGSPSHVVQQPALDQTLHRHERAYDSITMDPSRKLIKHQVPQSAHSTDTLVANPKSRQHTGATEASLEAPVPNFDAPKSAVNAGVRMVKVMYGERSMKLPVSPTSTPVDLLTSANDLLEYGFDPQRYVLQEHFKQLELQRPLRYYERVRDVMNSWDSDEQHWFNIVSAATEWDSASLRYTNAPRAQPEETTVTVYHSQRPRVWDKRSITLRVDGQVVVQKHAGAPATNICHMTDFDVFMPTRKEMKELKAPRKYCFAIKSLQKPAMFLDAANFVHFISTKDQDVAMEWYKAVHSWRSWYFVNSLGLGKDQPKPSSSESKEPLVVAIRGRNFSTSSSNQPPHSSSASKDRVLPGTNLVSSPVTESLKFRSPTRALTNRGAPPSSFPRALSASANDDDSNRVRARSASRTRSSSTARARPPCFGPEPFKANGLLGRTYTLKRQAMDAGQDEGNDIPKVPELPGKPLIDLAAERKVAVQQSYKGHGVALDSVPAGGLVTAATNTSPEHAPAMLGSHALQEASGTGGLQRSTSRRTRTLKDEHQYQDAFTGGLLAQAGDGQGDRRKGRGVAVGDRDATKPMLELQERSQYVPGSLLESVERNEDRRPVIQREKIREVAISTGEAW